MLVCAVMCVKYNDSCLQQEVCFLPWLVWVMCAVAQQGKLTHLEGTADRRGMWNEYSSYVVVCHFRFVF